MITTPSRIAALTVLLVASTATAQTLAHRYSFTSDLSDSVGSADLAINGSALISGGVLDLTGGVAEATGGSLTDIGASIQIGNAVTFEFWFNQDTTQNWSKLLTTGDSSNDFIAVTPKPGNGNDVRGQINSGGGGEAVVNSSSVTNGTDYYLGVSIDGAALGFTGGQDPEQLGPMIVSIGQLGGSLSTFEVALQGEDPQVIPYNSFQLGGAAGIFGDPNWDGQIDEFRIWSDALSQSDLAANFAAGPDVVAIPEPSTFAYALLAGLLGMVMSRRRRT